MKTTFPINLASRPYRCTKDDLGGPGLAAHAGAGLSALTSRCGFGLAGVVGGCLLFPSRVQQATRAPEDPSKGSRVEEVLPRCRGECPPRPPPSPLQGSPAEVSVGSFSTCPGATPASCRAYGAVWEAWESVARCAPDAESGVACLLCVPLGRVDVCVGASRLGLGCAVLDASHSFCGEQQGQAAGFLIHRKQLWFFLCSSSVAVGVHGKTTPHPLPSSCLSTLTHSPQRFQVPEVWVGSLNQPVLSISVPFFYSGVQDQTREKTAPEELWKTQLYYASGLKEISVPDHQP